MRPSLPIVVVAAWLVGSSSPARAGVILGQVDTFEDGTTLGWTEGANSPNPPTNVSSGGPQEAGDGYLENVSSGGTGAGSRWNLINDTGQWAGNYLTAGVDGIRADFLNQGSDTLTMRLAFYGSSTWYGSIQGFRIPPDGNWHRVTFDLSQLTLVNLGTATRTQVLSRASALRIVAATVPSYQGDEVATTAGVDNITALSLLVPTAPTTWGRLKDRYR